MGSTSASRFPASSELLRRCLASEPWTDALLHESLAEAEGRAFFSVVVERLGDLFEPRLCAVYAQLMADVLPGTGLLERYGRVRRVRRCTQEPRNIFVLSRVTLGADIAVTSVIIDALKRRFPEAAIWFVGPRKNYELFAADDRVAHLAFPYARDGSLQERLTTVPRLKAEDGIVVDPDSRLTQLGMVPISDDDIYYFFESRGYGADGEDGLPALSARWAAEVFGPKHSQAYLAPSRARMPADAAVSFGIGENEEKRIGGAFEEDLLRAIVEAGYSVVLDQGAGGVEAERAKALAERVAGVQLYGGAYAPFASMITQAKLYVGYDSAGQHVAAASGVPLISVFKGYPSRRMFARWRPQGRGPVHVVDAAGRDGGDVLAEALSYLHSL